MKEVWRQRRPSVSGYAIQRFLSLTWPLSIVNTKLQQSDSFNNDTEANFMSSSAVTTRSIGLVFKVSGWALGCGQPVMDSVKLVGCLFCYMARWLSWRINKGKSHKRTQTKQYAISRNYNNNTRQIFAIPVFPKDNSFNPTPPTYRKEKLVGLDTSFDHSHGVVGLQLDEKQFQVAN